MAEKTAEEKLLEWEQRINSWAGFELLSTEEPCIKNRVVEIYKTEYLGDKHTMTPVGDSYDNRADILKDFNPSIDNNVRIAANWVWRKYGKDWVITNILEGCAGAKSASNKSSTYTKGESDFKIQMGGDSYPFDRRLDRFEVSDTNGEFSKSRFVPFAKRFAELTTSGYIASNETLNKIENSKDRNDIADKVKEEYEKMSKNDFYKGVPSLQNYYAITRLYGSNGGQYLTYQKGKRRWYEVDVNSDSQYNYASVPTTSSIISWGKGDPYGRTPYQFTDFVFSKYWNKIPNNRLITLRRYAAPILDNLKFPGMVSESNYQNMKSGEVNLGIDDAGSVKDKTPAFPPMATAITYFGGETENNLKSLLQFTTGVLWDEVQASVWEVNTDTIPDNENTIGKIFGGISKFAEMLNVAGGHFERELIMNNGQLPPDPYTDGPYEHRIMGPVNRIDKVMKRKPGLSFEWAGLNLTFEYVGRPIGGISPKAVLLDILSNFLVIGSASAVFFGGAHRFMANPQKYPFMGGGKGIEAWYRGDPIGWGLESIKQFTQGGAKKESGGAVETGQSLFKSMENFFNQLFSGEKGNIFGAITSLFTGASGNMLNNFIANKTSGGVPYLHGMKAILTGEPIGEWHVTIGNPLNPIAMIGNLICDGITVEFNDELGPDDFPTEMKIIVKLKHAMARDRDAIESIFNRGMGRIYNLPDSMSGSADYQTAIDKATQTPTKVGYAPNRRMGILYKPGLDAGYIQPAQLEGRQNVLGSEISVWNRRSFGTGVSGNSSEEIPQDNELFMSAYRTTNWISKRATT